MRNMNKNWSSYKDHPLCGYETTIFIHKYSNSIGTTIKGNDGVLGECLRISLLAYFPVLPTKLPQLDIGYAYYYYININSLQITAYNKNISKWTQA